MADEPIAIDEAVIKNVVYSFYDRIRQDDILGPIFNARISDWETHMGRMCVFWSAVLLHTRGYDGRPMPKHVVLPIDGGHFDYWLAIFEETVRSICIEADADLYMKKARHIAHSLELGIANFNGVFLQPGERFKRKNIAS